MQYRTTLLLAYI